MYRYIDTNMSQVSKRILKPEIEERLFRNFWELFASIKSPKDIQLFLEDFLSPTEKVMLAKRIAISLLFSKGYDHRSISSLLKVSTSTVNNIARLLRTKGNGYKIIIQKYLQKESTKEFLQELERLIYRLQPGKHFLEEEQIKARLGHKRNLF